jgi:hypothetical protein
LASVVEVRHHVTGAVEQLHGDTGNTGFTRVLNAVGVLVQPHLVTDGRSAFVDEDVTRRWWRPGVTVTAMLLGLPPSLSLTSVKPGLLLCSTT